MEICYDEQQLMNYMTKAVDASPDHPVLIDKFLEDASEVDVDAMADGESTIIGGIMQHVEQAGVHSGDSACALPPYSLPQSIKIATYSSTTLVKSLLHCIQNQTYLLGIP